MPSEYVLIKRTALPQSLFDVLEVKHLIEEGNSVTNACKEIGISRSTYYKYCDDINELSNDYQKKATLLIKANNTKGILSQIVNEISSHGGNVLTINQDLPIHNLAYITIMIDMADVSIKLEDLVYNIKLLPNVKKTDILVFE